MRSISTQGKICADTVTLPNEGRNKSSSTSCSRRGNRLMPSLQGRGPECAVRFGRSEVALNVESDGSEHICTTWIKPNPAPGGVGSGRKLTQSRAALGPMRSFGSAYIEHMRRQRAGDRTFCRHRPACLASSQSNTENDERNKRQDNQPSGHAPPPPRRLTGNDPP